MRRLLAILLALCLGLTACGTAVPEPQTLPEGENSGPEVSYIPLDDRPVNADRVEYLAESLGYRLSMPEEDLYRTRLDGQGTNPNGTPYGDRAALYAWLREQEEAGCDRYVLSLDQLLSGGLVNSRSFLGEDVALPDGTVLSETEFLEAILALLSGEENEVYLLDTVMRLAPTVGYEGWKLSGYEALRSYGMAARPALAGDQLTLENILSAYPLGVDGEVLDPALFGVTQEAVDRYLLCRARKLRLVSEALTLTEGMENIHFLLGVDDSAPADSIQTNELAYLRQAVEGRGAVLSGADEDGMLAFCRMYARCDCEGKLPAVTVRYFGGSEDRASSGTVCLPCCLRHMLMHTFLVILVASRLKSRGCSMRSRKSHSRSRDSCTTSSASASLCRKSLASRSRLFRCCVAISMYVSVVISIGITHLRPNVMQFFAFTAQKRGSRIQLASANLRNLFVEALFWS